MKLETLLRNLIENLEYGAYLVTKGDFVKFETVIGYNGKRYEITVTECSKKD